MSKNRAINRKWLVGKLVKKLRRYPKLKHSEAKAYFKRRCDLDLNKSSLTRALTDARNVVYSDAASQYGLVKDYAETLLKSLLTEKRRKDANEEPSNNKKAKTSTKLKRQYKKFTCTYCDTKGHTKRSCSHKKADDIASALAATTAAVVASSKVANVGVIPGTTNAVTSNPQPGEVEANTLDAPLENVTRPPPPQQLTRPEKLPPKKKTSKVDPMQAASSGIAAHLAEFMKFVPTLGFKPPRKK
ncbi:hypothetical protein Ahy_B01g052186 [Arachis hypogaea]|uniref:CCHC-type domain-containing protein n=1 Tax=Arachis hypogaea TaxID=3818 RepID=A0A445ANR8_ARAHY|nr:hypothetical protein Ahy_B01g052186 [Arachis hypogaea]